MSLQDDALRGVNTFLFQKKETPKEKAERKANARKEAKNKDKDDDDDEEEEEEEDEDEQDDDEDISRSKEVKRQAFAFICYEPTCAWSAQLSISPCTVDL